jgi:hypothetical protein
MIEAMDIGFLKYCFLCSFGHDLHLYGGYILEEDKKSKQIIETMRTDCFGQKPEGCRPSHIFLSSFFFFYITTDLEPFTATYYLLSTRLAGIINTLISDA